MPSAGRSTSRDDEDLPDVVESEVLAALELDDAERDAALLELLQRHPDHAAAIRRWLRAAGAPLPGGTIVSTGEPPLPEALPQTTADDALPRRLGDYELQRVLGRGGFGTVYLAQQQRPIQRQVAIKILNPGMDSREVLARFAAEREALNRMDHPGIARLLDAGATPGGRPFFVMEYVDGMPLSAWCRRNGTPLRQRLQLFLAVLDAVQHAHQKAVIHRDLSSNNVLVTSGPDGPRPKIIDFGIAKSLAAPLVDSAAMTFQGTLLGTPEFMSPEQASGRVADVDTRADVYALGVQLYELLTDQLPIPGHVLRAQGMAGMAQVIREHQPVPPSEAAPAPRGAALRGDLDNIALRALAKRRDDRYPTVAEFAADLRRHLANEPVQAARPTTWYLLRKFVRRHWLPVSMTAAMVACLLAALAVSLWALRVTALARAEAEAEREKARARADAGYRLLASDELLHEAILREQALPPPWPDALPHYRAWLRDYGSPLAAELPKLAVKIDELLRGAVGNEPSMSDPADRHLLHALQRLQGALQEFVGDRGPMALVTARLRLGEQRIAPAVARHAESWQRTIAAIKRSDGQGASELYRGIQLAPQPGLVPLGIDPTTKLFEFLDLCSHDPSLPIPDRDPGTGALRVLPRTGIVFVLLPPGTFRIGANRGEPGLPQNDPRAEDDELPSQPVLLAEFLLARTELTQAQWEALTFGDRPSRRQDDMLPVTDIDWQSAGLVLQRCGMELPTEAQWEYACRARTTSPWWCGDEPARVYEHGWFGPEPQLVALFPPNPFGLFDQIGNVAEWCRDVKLDYRTSTPRAGDGLRTPANGGAAPQVELRVIRGGSCAEGPEAARSAARDGRPAQSRDGRLGLRPARSLRTAR